jgi:peptidoglycan hydrolase-like protein with peptidoglycan-binding domain
MKLKTFEQFADPVSEGFFDWLTGKQEDGEVKPKTGTPDVTDAAIKDFYETLQQFADSGKSILVQKFGSMQYSKMVEDIQLSLVFLGYPLPKYGIDGLFGIETATAIKRFNDATKKNQES